MYAELDQHSETRPVDNGRAIRILGWLVVASAILGGIATTCLFFAVSELGGTFGGMFFWAMAGVSLALLNFIVGLRVARSTLEGKYLAIPVLSSAIFVIPLIEFMFS